MRLSSSLGADARVWQLALGAGLVSLVVGLVAFDAASRESGTRCHVASTHEPATPPPMLVEPPGGSIIWGITAAPRAEIALDGGSHQIAHAIGQGELIGVTSAHRCARADLEVVRIAPGPRRVVHRDAEPSSTGYIPDGTYDLAITCDGVRGETTRLVVRASTR